MNVLRLLSFLFVMVGLVRASEVKQSLYEHATLKAMPLLLAVSPEDDKELLQIAQILGKNLERSGQFTVTVKGMNEPTKKSELDAVFEKGFPLQIFLHHDDGRKSIGWRLYDVADQRLVRGRKCTKRGALAHGYADNLADDIWPVLTNQPSSFSSKIAFVKKRPTQGQKERQRSIVCVANSDGSHEQIIIPQLGTYVSLYWHYDKNNPCIFCSEFTRTNVRFASANFLGQKRTVLDLKGTCVGISLSPDSNKAVYCRSGTIWEYSYDPSLGQGKHSVLIANDGNNVSPTLLPSGDVIFCSDAGALCRGARSSGPKIMQYSARDKSVTLLTKEGYCVGPSYCKAHHKIVYSKKVQGFMQLFVYDTVKHTDTQLTFDPGNKIDCCWSPCGNYVVFCYQQGRISRIAIMHVALKKRTYITQAQEHCSSPAWSPVFDEVPVVKSR